MFLLLFVHFIYLFLFTPKFSFFLFLLNYWFDYLLFVDLLAFLFVSLFNSLIIYYLFCSFLWVLLVLFISLIIYLCDCLLVVCLFFSEFVELLLLVPPFQVSHYLRGCKEDSDVCTDVSSPTVRCFPHPFFFSHSSWAVVMNRE